MRQIVLQVWLVSACALGALVAAESSARAQAPEAPWRASVALGGGRTWDDEGSLGAGSSAGVALERRLVSGTSVQLAFDALWHDRGGGFFRASGRTTLVAATLVQRFGRGAVQPYVVGGVLLARHVGHVQLDDGPRQPRRSVDGGLTFGGGLAIRLTSRVDVGPDVRVYTLAPANDVDPALAWAIVARVGYRF